MGEDKRKVAGTKSEVEKICDAFSIQVGPSFQLD
jgi:hypothetical protein